MNPAIEKIREEVLANPDEMSICGTCASCGEDLLVTINFDIPEQLVAWTSDCGCGDSRDVFVTREQLLTLTDDFLRDEIFLDPDKRITA